MVEPCGMPPTRFPVAICGWPTFVLVQFLKTMPLLLVVIVVLLTSMALPTKLVLFAWLPETAFMLNFLALLAFAL